MDGKFDWKRAISLCHTCTFMQGSSMEYMLNDMPDKAKVEALKSILAYVGNEYVQIYSNICDTPLTEGYRFTKEDCSPSREIIWLRDQCLKAKEDNMEIKCPQCGGPVDYKIVSVSNSSVCCCNKCGICFKKPQN